MGGTTAEFRAEVVEERLKRFGIGPLKDLAIVVAGNREDFTRVFHIRAVELVAVELVLVLPVNHVAQMQEERGIARGGCGGIVVGRHDTCGVFLSRRGPTRTTSVADRVKKDGTRRGDFIDPLLADDVPQIHGRGTARRGDRPQFLANELGHPPRIERAIHRTLVGGRGREEWLCISHRLHLRGSWFSSRGTRRFSCHGESLPFVWRDKRGRH